MHQTPGLGAPYTTPLVCTPQPPTLRQRICFKRCPRFAVFHRDLIVGTDPISDAVHSRAALSATASKTGCTSVRDWPMTDSTLGCRRLLLMRFFQFACESSDFLLEIGGGYTCSRRFACLWPKRPPSLYRLAAFTASLHVARLRRFTAMLNFMQVLPLAPWQQRVIRGVARNVRSGVIRGNRFRSAHKQQHHAQHSECHSNCKPWPTFDLSIQKL